MLRAPALPEAEGLFRVFLASAPVLGEWVLPLGALAGLTALLTRWRSEGEWLALQAAGIAGRHLVAPALSIGLVVGLGTAALTHHGAVWGRATLFDVLVHQVQPLPGRATSIGGLTVLPGTVEGVEDGLRDLLLAWEGPDGLLVASAAVGRLSQGRVLELEEGEVLGASGRLTFDRLQLPLPDSARRPPPSAWTGPDLARSSDPYLQAIRLKRNVWPLAGVLLLLLSVPLSLSGRGWTVPGAVLGWWAAVRACDGLALQMGGLGSALLPLLLLGGFSFWTWWRWSER